jgi:hypothetical protein
MCKHGHVPNYMGPKEIVTFLSSKQETFNYYFSRILSTYIKLVARVRYNACRILNPDNKLEHHVGPPWPLSLRLAWLLAHRRSFLLGPEVGQRLLLLSQHHRWRAARVALPPRSS